MRRVGGTLLFVSSEIPTTHASIYKDLDFINNRSTSEYKAHWNDYQGALVRSLVIMVHGIKRGGATQSNSRQLRYRIHYTNKANNKYHVLGGFTSKVLFHKSSLL